MARETLAVTQDFINQCTELLQEFDAVRYDSFIRYIEMMLEVSTDCAESIAEKMEERKDIITTAYADTYIVKLESTVPAVYRYLDAFDAYLCIMQKEREESEKRSCYAIKAAFPIDFSIYVSNGRTYYMLIYDKHFAQRMNIYEKAQAGDSADPVTLVVIPVGTNLGMAHVPKIKGKVRFAVVKKSKTGLTVCEASGIQGE